MKKILAIIIMFSVLLGMVLPYSASASQKPKVTYQQAIEIAKKSFSLDTKDYDVSHNYQENEEGRGFYEINWTKKEGYSQISVSVDAVTSDIIRMYRYEPSKDSHKKIPKYTNADALKAAEAFIKNIQPKKFSQMKLYQNEYKDSQLYMSQNSYFKFYRVANGIEFTENGIGIEVDKNTLKIISYEYSWDDTQLPDTSKAISLERAQEIFKEKLGLELSYKLITKQDSKEPTPILVYTLKDSNYPIDALTGEVIYTRNIVRSGSANLKFSKVMYDKNEMTPEELKSIEEDSKLISKEAAVAVVEKYIPQIKDFKLESSNLYSIGNSDAAKWRFSWNYNNKEKDTNVYGFINAEVDAVNSKLISFHIDGNKFYPEEKKEPSYSKEQAKDLAEKFLKDIEPDKFSQCEYRDLYKYITVEKPSSYNFYYIRKYNGAACPFNTFTISVNAYTGQIMSYNLNWKEYSLPSTEGVIKLEDAYKALFEKADFSLEYIRSHKDIVNNNISYDIKLAYLLDDNFIMLDGKNGDLLDYNGKPLKKANTLSFIDIKGTPYEKDILLLIELGIIDADDGKFNPNTEILQKDFIKLVIKSIDPYIDNRNESNDYDVYYKEAITRKLISEAEKKPDSKVTRLQASKVLVRALGLGSVAELSDIYVLKAKDLKSIPQNMTGYAALSSRLGIVKLNNGNFNPSLTLKRGEAASIIINYLNVDLIPAQ